MWHNNSVATGRPQNGFVGWCKWLCYCAVLVGLSGCNKLGVETLDGIVLFSEVKGLVTENGRPLPGVKVERVVLWDLEDDHRIDSTVSDENGVYRFPALEVSTDLGYLTRKLHMPGVIQRIDFYLEGKKVRAYYHYKRDYAANSETGYPVIEIESDASKANDDFVSGQYEIDSFVKRRF